MNNRGGKLLLRQIPQTNVRLLIADDVSESREMLRRALSFDSGIEVVGEAGSGGEAVRKAEALHPDVVLMDVRMPEGNGIDATRALSLRVPEVRVIALTAYEDADTVRAMLAAGAAGYVVKGASIDDLASAVRRAHSGEEVIDLRVLPQALDELRRQLNEERSRRKEVERLSRLREEFVHVLAYELRTPFTVMAGALRSLAKREFEGDTAELIAPALRRAEQLERVIEGLELLGDGSAFTGRTNPKHSVTEALTRLGHTLDRLELADDEWRGVPPQRLTRVAFELIDNAVRHGRPPVEVRAFRRDGEGVLEVRDRGDLQPDPGLLHAVPERDIIPEEDGRSGLGLFVAARLCEAGGGRLQIRREGQNTEAEASFPLSE
jgi:DNA-binding NarL/FixJ family response regulator/anti-sigma regulatory factor (Ser/Thr protein kinase)